MLKIHPLPFTLIVIITALIVSGCTTSSYSKSVNNSACIRPSITSDKKDNANIAWQTEDNDNFHDNHVYFAKINSLGDIVHKEEIGYIVSTDYSPSIGIDNNLNIFVAYSNSVNNQMDVYYSKFIFKENTSIKNIQLTDTIYEAGAPILLCDDNSIHIIWMDKRDLYSKSELYYSKIDLNGEWKIKDKRLTFNMERTYLRNMIIDKNNSIYILNEIEKKGEYLLKIDSNGIVIQNETIISSVVVIPDYQIVTDDNGNLIYLANNGIVDSNNDVHIITSSSASLLYTKLNRTGTKLIENKTIATHEKKKGYEYGPSIFDPKVAIDSEDNIHITWYINDGGNHFSIWYEKIDPNGTVLIPAMKIAPEDEKGNDSTPGFELIPLIMVVLVAAAVMRRRR